MRIFEKGKFKKQATQFVKEWTRLLSADKFQEALDLLDIKKKEDYDFEWTIESLKFIFQDYGGPNGMPVINDPFQLNKKDFIEFYKYNDGSGWKVEYDLPMDGERSELTAQFSFERASEDVYNVYLHDLLIM